MQSICRSLPRLSLSSRPLTTSLRLARWETTGPNARNEHGTAKVPQPTAQDPPGYRSGASGHINEQGPMQGQPRHKPDYDVAVDYRTSVFSPIPARVMDGSEEGQTLPAAVLSGAPVDLQARTVRIYRPTKTATQSGDWQGHHWRMDWDILGKGHRWENPLMGWQSSGDFMQGTHMYFKSRDDAIKFAEKQGYEYFVQEPNERKIVPKAYADMFTWSPKKLKHIRTK